LWRLQRGELAAMPASYSPGNLLLQLHITDRCNLRCVHCYQGSFTDNGPPHEGLLAIVEQFREFVVSCKGHKYKNGIRGHLTVTGGEPFLRPDFMELLQSFSADRGLCSFAILTNGTLIDQAAASRLGKLKPSFVQVSLDGVKESHDRIRGPGAFAKAVSGVRLLAKEGVRTFISFTAHSDNYQEFPSVAEIARSLRVARVWADRFIPAPSGSFEKGEAQAPRGLSPTETLSFIRLMHRAQGEKRRGGWFGSNRTEVPMHRALQFLVGGGVPYRCSAGDSLIAVLPNGDVYPCRRLPIKCGNILEKPLAEIYHEDKTLRALRDRGRVPEGCRKCFFATVCRGGLKCLSYAVTGSPFETDPGCWLGESAASCRQNIG